MMVKMGDADGMVSGACHLIQVFLFLIKPAYHFCFYQKTGGKMLFKDYLFTKYSSYHTRKV